MANVTYLLGAGASCNCLPTYANFRERFSVFKKRIQGSLTDLNPEEKEIALEIGTICERLTSEFTFHFTPDTIAKKYFHLRGEGQKNLDDLKTILILFFLHEQCVSESYIQNTPKLKDHKSQVDKRYDSFIAAMLEPKYYQIKLNPDVSILTWNYDLQFELCFKNYYNQSLNETLYYLQSIPSYPSLNPDFNFDINKFSIVHLNGIAYNKKESAVDSYPYGQFLTSAKELVKEIIQHYISIKASAYLLTGKGLLNFAWERDNSYPFPKHALEQTMNRAIEVANKTEVLVVIGYSFPIFNKVVDTTIFEQMKRLKKIYIQSPIAEDIKSVIVDAFGAGNNQIKEDIIVPVKALEYFHIPQEIN